MQKTVHEKLKSLMAEQPHAWFTIKDITEQFNCGYSIARTACNQLVKNGYAERRDVTNSGNGSLREFKKALA